MIVKWRGYLRRYPSNHGARLLLTIGCRTASEAAIKTRATHKAKLIDDDTCTSRLELIEE